MAKGWRCCGVCSLHTSHLLGFAFAMQRVRSWCAFRAGHTREGLSVIMSQPCASHTMLPVRYIALAGQ